MSTDDKKRLEDLRINRCSCAEDEDFLFAQIDKRDEALRQIAILGDPPLVMGSVGPVAILIAREALGE